MFVRTTENRTLRPSICRAVLTSVHRAKRRLDTSRQRIGWAYQLLLNERGHCPSTLQRKPQGYPTWARRQGDGHERRYIFTAQTGREVVRLRTGNLDSRFPRARNNRSRIWLQVRARIAAFQGFRNRLFPTRRQIMARVPAAHRTTDIKYTCARCLNRDDGSFHPDADRLPTPDSEAILNVLHPLSQI
jgi:hypothetical protein